MVVVVVVVVEVVEVVVVEVVVVVVVVVVKKHSPIKHKLTRNISGRKEMFYLATLSTHFI